MNYKSIAIYDQRNANSVIMTSTLGSAIVSFTSKALVFKAGVTKIKCSFGPPRRFSLPFYNTCMFLFVYDRLSLICKHQVYIIIGVTNSLSPFRNLCFHGKRLKCFFCIRNVLANIIRRLEMDDPKLPSKKTGNG